MLVGVSGFFRDGIVPRAVNVGSGGDVYALPVVPERKSVYVTYRP